MKHLFILLCNICIAVQLYAQPIICSGSPLSGIDGNTYHKTTSTGPGMFGAVASLKNGRLFATNNGKLKYISTAGFSVFDSMNINIAYLTNAGSNDTMFGLKTNALLYQFSTVNKTIIDSIPIAGLYHVKMTERPTTNEVWVCGLPVNIIDYTNALAVTKVMSLGYNITDVKFSSDGLKAYAISATTKTIYSLDAVNKTVLDSLNITPDTPAALEISADNSKLFVAVTGKVRVYQASGFSLTSSINMTRPVAAMYRHPFRKEIWCVQPSGKLVSVFNATNYALIDSTIVGDNPASLAFGDLSTSVEKTLTNDNINIYPNPASTTLEVECGHEDHTISLYDLNGILLQEKQSSGKRTTFFIDTLPPGNYIVKITNGTGIYLSKTFSKI